MPSLFTRRARRGFTLIELLVTIVILGLLAALTIPALEAVEDRADARVTLAELQALARSSYALAALDGQATFATLEALGGGAAASDGPDRGRSLAARGLLRGNGAPARTEIDTDTLYASDHQSGFVGVVVAP